jgi:hypothetical protein
VQAESSLSSLLSELNNMFDQMNRGQIEAPTVLRVMQLSRESASRLLLQSSSQIMFENEVKFEVSEVNCNDIFELCRNIKSCQKQDREETL